MNHAPIAVTSSTPINHTAAQSLEWEAEKATLAGSDVITDQGERGRVTAPLIPELMCDLENRGVFGHFVMTIDGFGRARGRILERREFHLSPLPVPSTDSGPLERSVWEILSR